MCHWYNVQCFGPLIFCKHVMSLGRKCIYDEKAIKYLVQVRDDVEAGDEKLKELEQEMKDWGIYDTDFCLGDVIDDEDPWGHQWWHQTQKEAGGVPCCWGRGVDYRIYWVLQKGMPFEEGSFKEHPGTVGEGQLQGAWESLSLIRFLIWLQFLLGCQFHILIHFNDANRGLLPKPH